MLEFWTSEVDSIKSETIPHKLEVTSKILHLARGKKIKMEEPVRQIICTFSNKSEHDEIREKMTELITNLCSVPNQAALDGLKDLINLENINADQKVQLLVPLVENELFESNFKSKMVQYLIKHKNQVRFS